MAMATNDAELISYLTSKNISTGKTNQGGKDPMFFAIQNESLTNIKALLQNNYDLTIDKLESLEIPKCKNDEVVTFLSDLVFIKIANFSDAVKYINSFDKYKYKIIQDDFYERLTISISDYPELVSLLEKNSPNYTQKDLQLIDGFKTDYINSFTQINDVISAIKKFNYSNVSTFPIDFITNYKNDLNPLLNTVERLDFLKAEVKAGLLSQIEIQINENKINKELKSVSIYQKIKILESGIFYASGDGASLVQFFNSSDKNYSFENLNVFVVGTIKNVTEKTVKVRTIVYYNIETKTQILFKKETAHSSVAAENFHELLPGETKVFATVMKLKSEQQSFDIGSTMTDISKENPYKVDIQLYTNEIPQFRIDEQNILINQLLTSGNIPNLKGWTKEVELFKNSQRESCITCKVNWEKTKHIENYIDWLGNLDSTYSSCLATPKTPPLYHS